MQREVNLHTTVVRLFVLRELERHYGQREFRFTDVKRLAVIHGADRPSLPVSMREAGQIIKLGGGKYRLSEQSFKILRQAKEVLT